MNTKQLLAKIDNSWYQLAEVISDIDGRTLTASGQDGWSIKDHLVHLAAWEWVLLAHIQGHDPVAAIGIGDVDPSNISGINNAVWKLHRDDSVDDVVLYFRDSHEGLRAELAKLDSTHLLLPYTHYQPNEADRYQAVIESVAAETFDHYDEHRRWIEERLAEPAGRPL